MTLTTEVSDVDVIYELDIDLDLINHLAIRESVFALRREQVQRPLIRDELSRNVFAWQLQHLRDHGEPATGSVLENEFPDIALVKPETAIDDLILRLRSRYLKNEGRRHIREIADLAVSDPTAVAHEMQARGRALVDLTQTRGEVFGTGDYARAKEQYDQAVIRGMGPSLGYDELDEHYGGQIGVTFVIAPPKCFKSWYTVNVFVENVTRERSPYLFSLELPAVETYWRAACLTADVPYWKYLKRKLMPDELRRVETATQILDEGGSYAIDKPGQGSRSVAQLVERATDSGADCILIDQLQYIENRKGVSIGAMNNTADYFEVVNDLRNWSDHIPIFVVHQFNRSVIGATEMPEMQQAKGSSAIEEVATLVLGLWANKEMRQSNVVELGSLAARNYSHGSWELGVSLSRHCSLNLNARIED